MPKTLVLRSRSNPQQNLKDGEVCDPDIIVQDLRHDITFEHDEILSDQKVADCLAEIHQLSLETIAALNKIVHMDEYSWPGLRDTDYWYKNLYALFRDAMGMEFEEPLDHAFRRLHVDLRDISLYVRMTIMAELTDQIFVSTFPRVPIISRAWAGRAFRPLIKGTPSDQDVVQQALLAWRNDSEVKKQTSQNAKTFAEEMIETLSPLLSDYKSSELNKASDRTRQRSLLKQCGSHLEGMYVVAMMLRNEMNLKKCTYEFFWPKVGDEFDRKAMDMEAMSLRKECTAADAPEYAVVVATLLPGICRIGQDSDHKHGMSTSGKATLSKGKVIVRALVHLNVSGEGPDHMN